MAEGADGRQGRIGFGSRVAVIHPHFRSAGVVVDEDPVPPFGAAGAGLDIPHVGPEIIRAGPFGLVGPRVEDEDIVHFSVPVVVVGGEIDVGIDGVAGVDDQFVGVLVLAFIVVLAIEGVVLRERDHVGDVETEGVAVLPLVLEIGEGGLGAGPVDDPLEILAGIGEGEVLELGQDDEAVPDTSVSSCAGTGALTGVERFHPGAADGPFPPEQVEGNVPAGGDDGGRGVRIAGMFPGVQPMAENVIAGIAPPSFRILDERTPVRCQEEVAEFVTGKIGLDARPVRLPEIQQPFPGGRGREDRRQAQEYGKYQRQASQTGWFRFHTIQMTAFFGAFAILYAKNRPHSRENRFFDVY